MTPERFGVLLAALASTVCIGVGLGFLVRAVVALLAR